MFYVRMRKAEMRKGEVYLAFGSQQTRKVPCFSTPLAGLVVHKCYPNMDKPPEETWVLTHEGSGYRLATFSTLTAVGRVLPFYALVDWTQCAEALKEDATVNRLHKEAIYPLAENACFRRKGAEDRFREILRDNAAYLREVMESKMLNPLVAMGRAPLLFVLASWLDGVQ